MLTQLQREWRSPLLRLVFITLIIAITGMSSVTFFTDKLQRGLQSQRQELLGGDYALTSDQIIDQRLLQTTQPIKQTQYVSFLSMINAGDSLKLASIKAVDNGYPLVGSLMLSTTLETPPTATRAIPTTGTAWASRQLMALMNLQIHDQITIGNASFTISAILEAEPDRGERWFAIAPRIMINFADMDKTGVIVPGSRLNHQAMFTGEAEPLNRFITELAQNITINEKIIVANTYQPALTRVLERTQHYLELATLLTLLLASIAMTIALLRYFQQNRHRVALMRCFGCHMSEIISYYSKIFFVLTLLACLIGCSLGYLGQRALSSILNQFIAIDLPAVSWRPIWWATLSGIFIVAAVVVPLLVHLRNIPPMLLIRQITLPIRLVTLAIITLITTCLLTLLYCYTQNIKLTTTMSMGVIVLTALLLPFNRLLLKLLNYSRDKIGLAWQFAIANLYRNRRHAAFELTTFSMIITVLLLITVIRNDIIDQWKTTPSETPNYFVINITPADLSSLQQFLQQQQITTTEFFPMIRGRIVALNGLPIRQALAEDKHIHNALNRALNFSWIDRQLSDEMPRTSRGKLDSQIKEIPTQGRLGYQRHETLTQGRWWTAAEEAAGAPMVSIEAGLAQQLGFRLGDVVGVQIDDQQLEVTITSFRQVEWRSIQPNFYMLFPKPLLQPYSKTFITSMRINPEDFSLLGKIHAQFPAITLLDVSAIADQFQAVLNNLAFAIEFIMLFTLIAVVLILMVTLMTSLDYRRRQHAIIRAIGGSRSLLKRALMLEFCLLGFLAGSIAVVAANGLGYLFARSVLELTYTPAFSIGFIVPLTTGAMVMFVSYLIERQTLTVSPHQALRP